LRTSDAVSPVPAGALLTTLITFVCIYSLFMGAFLVFVVRMIRCGPENTPAQAEASGSLKFALRPQIMNAGRDPVRQGR
jgi:cytochrome d ubiquinol oxidase subunit I